MSVRVMPKSDNTNSLLNNSGLKENEQTAQTPTSATVRLPYRNGTEPQAGSMGSKELVQISSGGAEAGVEGGGGVEDALEDRVTPKEGGSVDGEEDVERGDQVGARPPSLVVRASSPYQS